MAEQKPHLYVSDTGPLISWARAGLLLLFRQLVGEVIVPGAVMRELDHPGRAGAELVREEWVRKQILPVGYPRIGFPKDLGEGEREAIALAQLLEGYLIVDDASARGEAENRGIPCLTTLRLLAQAKQDGLAKKVAPLLGQLRDSGFRLNDAVAIPFLTGMDES